MRDKVDYRTLTSANVFEGIKAPIPLSYQGKKDWREETRKEWKLATRQFSRILEMALKKNLMKSAIDLTSEGTNGNASPNKRKLKMLDSDEKEYRLLVKERLARMNYEILAPMSRSEKREVLQQVSSLFLFESMRAMVLSEQLTYQGCFQTYESCVDEYLRLLDQMGEI